MPPSIREAALGVGASKLQVVFHHVLPLAMPGILTGTIIGMARALGETAPLLMIGMVAFIVDVPGGVTDAATVLPVQIFLWADSAERGFVERTVAAIIVLLVVPAADERDWPSSCATGSSGAGRSGRNGTGYEPSTGMTAMTALRPTASGCAGEDASAATSTSSMARSRR